MWCPVEIPRRLLKRITNFILSLSKLKILYTVTLKIIQSVPSMICPTVMFRSKSFEVFSQSQLWKIKPLTDLSSLTTKVTTTMSIRPTVTCGRPWL